MGSKSERGELMPPSIRNWESAREAYRQFVDERDWEQFHNPKDLATGLSIEASELLELTLWKTPEELGRELRSSDGFREDFLNEASDILLYVIRLFDVLGEDPWRSVERKMAQNREKYPQDLVRGSSQKYTAYRSQELNSSEKK